MIKTSPSKINLYNECKRCYWLQEVKGVKRPRGIMSSLPNGIDGIIKGYLDYCRSKKILPKELKALEGKYQLYPDQAKIFRWRNWRTGPTYVSKLGLTLSGAIDDLLVDIRTGAVAPFDIKSKGKEPAGVEESQKYYQSQMDCYSLMFEKNGMTTTGSAHLLYFYPTTEMPNNVISFETRLISFPVDPKAAAEKCIGIIELLKQTAEPEPNPGCEYCNYISSIRGNYA